MGWSNGGVWLGDGGWSKALASDAAQTTAFLSRTSGLSGTETAAYKALINGLVADATFSLLDALYILATNTAASAALNLISTSFPLTLIGTPTFTADVGYTGNGANSGLDTGLITASNYSQNSASLGIAIQTNDTSSVGMLEIGGTGSSNFFLGPNFSLTSIYAANEAGFNQPAATTSKGLTAVSRTASGSVSLYKDGSSTAVNTAATSSNGVISASVVLCGRNNGSGGLNNASSRQISAAWVGGGLTGAQFASISSRINAYLTALSVPVY